MRAYKILLALTILLLCCSYAYGAVPQTIDYQGFITNTAGNPINATVQMQISLYSVPTGGTALWTETDNVIVKDGYYSVVLGQSTTFPANLFDTQPLYFGVKVGTDQEMTPRQILNSSAFALKAAVAESVPNQSITTSKIASGAVTDSAITGPISGSKISSSGLDAEKLGGVAASGYASATHSHSQYLSSSGGTVSGPLNVAQNGYIQFSDNSFFSTAKHRQSIYVAHGDNDVFATEANMYVPINTADFTGQGFEFSQTDVNSFTIHKRGLYKFEFDSVAYGPDVAGNSLQIFTEVNSMPVCTRTYYIKWESSYSYSCTVFLVPNDIVRIGFWNMAKPTMKLIGGGTSNSIVITQLYQE